jgi:hypothetical protein
MSTQARRRVDQGETRRQSGVWFLNQVSWRLA